ncbi:MAG: hypothetical protein K1X68_01450 [Saprospiraceae bacterium]|nr:hypothetical protein [Saprospiraceae bacterium]HMW40043.1 hypothetical protein [Saprospiraceae bacterium]HMX89163.1 hypothetical protein [Saprospiraceae bacterium]HMZ40776.1 hypothetical protein [Saprospiraceae bacterium]HNA65619.1 hypothetical protein [Saprospiraceae bacterium]
MSYPSFKDLDKLHDWFKANDAPYWTVYSGREADRSKRVAANTGIKDVDASFAWMRKLIEDMSETGGSFHIHAKNSPKDDADVKSLAEKAALRLTTSGFHAIFETSSQGVGFGRVAGVPSVGEIDRLVEEKVNQRMEIYEKEAEIAALNDEIQQIKKAKGIFGMTPQEFVPMAATLISQLSSLLKGNSQAPPQPTPQLKISGVNPNTESEAEFSEEDQARIDEAIARLSVHFDNIPQIMEQLAAWVEKNPEFAKSMLQNLK